MKMRLFACFPLLLTTICAQNNLTSTGTQRYFDVVRRNLEASHYLFFSQRVLLALVESGLSRDDAYQLVQRNAMRAWDEELDFRELVRREDEIASRVDLEAVFDLSSYTRHVDIVFARLHSIAVKEEPVHV